MQSQALRQPCFQPLSASRREHASGRLSCVKVLAAKQYSTIREKPRARGFVQEDNSGKSNIFGVEPRSLYTSSPTADRAARQGLGGQQGLIVVAVCIAVIAAVTFLGKEGPQTLAQVSAVADSRDSLSALAASIKASI
ncbi:hypothetical protein COCSUDRAFT_52726 [Coccomyxa subellipsoidea C-169]|uniref:Uncharacterized protein n=1 Tax=Coccomyxa subellipsoidea (strain C-169) TaxID=574566 RepID=I0Z2W0_COCSC|nr:hypothetical protein COCSUDRAFT_52726 [Coccomyxa subellipsoidea C-169]EIE24979.1 hypothetical protein COCSUDRAFT_52726 [Coccomyxa subellipsoidea C-169]|eukprot:XP_005649523.1 hypothetical protein COCSUDRAFT_52726 [Coccomyxa subellipsoidea C-169]